MRRIARKFASDMSFIASSRVVMVSRSSVESRCKGLSKLSRYILSDRQRLKALDWSAVAELSSESFMWEFGGRTKSFIWLKIECVTWPKISCH